MPPKLWSRDSKMIGRFQGVDQSHLYTARIEEAESILKQLDEHIATAKRERNKLSRFLEYLKLHRTEK